MRVGFYVPLDLNRLRNGNRAIRDFKRYKKLQQATERNQLRQAARAYSTERFYYKQAARQGHSFWYNLFHGLY